MHEKTRVLEVYGCDGVGRIARRSGGKSAKPTIKVGVVGAKTGPLAPGAAITHFPPYQLWAHEVNERGGLKLKDGQRKVEMIEYDDHTRRRKPSRPSSG